jgi:lysophospholipase L1-like esterase
MITQFLLPVTFAFFTLLYQPQNNSNPMNNTFTYLALGDSYTIGESVAEKERFPAQTAEWLKANTNKHCSQLDYIAKTGFTCEELQAAITEKNIQKTYTIVSLLIGVNDQYRGYDIALYEERFKSLLQQAIVFANNKPTHVFVLSIPDWGVTPFAADRNVQAIAKEIDAYNAINKKVALQFGTNYINITESTRAATTNNSLIAADGLHPSGTEYKKWADELAPIIAKKVFGK